MIRPMETMSVSAGKARFNEVNRMVADQHDRVSFTTNGVEETVLVAKADLEALEETIAILADRSAMSGLADARAERDNGIPPTSAAEMGDIIRCRQTA